jgi:hypothetical protein
MNNVDVAADAAVFRQLLGARVGAEVTAVQVLPWSVEVRFADGVSVIMDVVHVRLDSVDGVVAVDQGDVESCAAYELLLGTRVTALQLSASGVVVSFDSGLVLHGLFFAPDPELPSSWSVAIERADGVVDGFAVSRSGLAAWGVSELLETGPVLFAAPAT